MTRAERMQAILTAAFAPTRLVIEDDSARHAGHAGASGPDKAHLGQTHFNITIAAESLASLSRVEAHRAVNTALAGEFASGLHALAIRIER